MVGAGGLEPSSPDNRARGKIPLAPQGASRSGVSPQPVLSATFGGSKGGQREWVQVLRRLRSSLSKVRGKAGGGTEEEVNATGIWTKQTLQARSESQRSARTREAKAHHEGNPAGFCFMPKWLPRG